jgi:hypothetical protein
MQTSSARGLQEEICEMEEKRLGSSVLPWQPYDLPKIFIWAHPLSVPSFTEFYQILTKISDFLVITIISSQTSDVTTQNIESAITWEWDEIWRNCKRHSSSLQQYVLAKQLKMRWKFRFISTLRKPSYRSFSLRWRHILLTALKPTAQNELYMQ